MLYNSKCLHLIHFLKIVMITFVFKCRYYHKTQLIQGRIKESVVINYLLDTNDANITENKMFCFIIQLND